MPYRRNYRRRTLRKRRPMRRTRRMIRRPLKRTLNVHHFKRTLIGTDIPTATGTTFGAVIFRLNQLADFADFTNLYDSYRINKVVWKLVPNVNSAEAGATQKLPQVHSVIDTNDNTAPTALTQLVQYSNYRMTMGSRIHTRMLTPASRDEAFQSTGTAYPATINFKKWITTEYPAITFLGIKYAIGSTAAAAAVTYTPYVTFYFSCKNVK